MEQDTYQIQIPRVFYDTCTDDPDLAGPIADSYREFITLGSYDFLIAQARYFAWPHLTPELLAATLVHENAHSTLTLATATGHLQLHLRNIYETAPKSPPFNKLAELLRQYLSVVTGSSIFAQETHATMSAYVSLHTVFGKETAEGYLAGHRDSEPDQPSPYLAFTRPAIDLLSRNGVPLEEWLGYTAFLASLAMNVDMDAIARVLGDLPSFRQVCGCSEQSADSRFTGLFQEFRVSMKKGGLPPSVKQSLENKYNCRSQVSSRDLPRLIANALLDDADSLGLSPIDVFVLKQARDNSKGFPGELGESIFFASQPTRYVTPDTYVFHMDNSACQECDLIELGLAANPENVTYGGININFYTTLSPPMKASFSMVHPCYALAGSHLLDGKTIVVYFTWDLLEGIGGGLMEPVKQILKGRPVIYVFFGHYGKFVSWLQQKKNNLRYAVAELSRPPVRFIIFRDNTDDLSTYILPVAPVIPQSLDTALNSIQSVPMTLMCDATLKDSLDKFFVWYVFAPVTC